MVGKRVPSAIIYDYTVVPFRTDLTRTTLTQESYPIREQDIRVLLSKCAINICLTHISLASHKNGIGKQCRPRSDDAERGV